MIEVKADSKPIDGKKGVEISCSFSGIGSEIAEEALHVIGTLMHSLKTEDEDLFMDVILALATHSEILRGDYSEEDTAEDNREALAMSKLMSKGIPKGGLN